MLASQGCRVLTNTTFLPKFTWMTEAVNTLPYQQDQCEHKGYNVQMISWRDMIESQFLFFFALSHNQTKALSSLLVSPLVQIINSKPLKEI